MILFKSYLTKEAQENNNESTSVFSFLFIFKML